MKTKRIVVLFCAVCGESIRVGEHCLLIHRRSGKEIGRTRGHYAGNFDVLEDAFFAAREDTAVIGNPNAYQELMKSAESLPDSCGIVNLVDADYIIQSLKAERSTSKERFIIETIKGVVVSEPCEGAPLSGISACHSVCAELCRPVHLRVMPPSFWCISKTKQPPRKRFMQKSQQEGENNDPKNF